MELYRDHLIEKRIIPEGSAYGLYQPIFLKPYFHNSRDFARKNGFLQPKPWHGSPMATLRRGFAALSSPRACQLRTPIMEQLKTLQNFYFADYTGCSPLAGVDFLQPPPTVLATKRQRDHKDDEDREDHEESRKAPRLAGSTPPFSPATQQKGDSKRQAQDYPPSQEYQHSWNLGPEFTTEQAVARYAHLIT